MIVITALSRKGGSGKTTLMRALADAAVSNGHETLAIDADPQKALFRWHQDLGRETPGLTVKKRLLPTSSSTRWGQGVCGPIFWLNRATS